MFFPFFKLKSGMANSGSDGPDLFGWGNIYTLQVNCIIAWLKVCIFSKKIMVNYAES